MIYKRGYSRAGQNPFNQERVDTAQGRTGDNARTMNKSSTCRNEKPKRPPNACMQGRSNPGSQAFYALGDFRISCLAQRGNPVPELLAFVRFQEFEKSFNVYPVDGRDKLWQARNFNDAVEALLPGTGTNTLKQEAQAVLEQGALAVKESRDRLVGVHFLDALIEPAETQQAALDHFVDCHLVESHRREIAVHTKILCVDFFDPKFQRRRQVCNIEFVAKRQVHCGAENRGV